MKNVIRVSQLKLKPDESEKKLKNMIIHTLKLPADAQIEWKIFKKSLDARHKPDIYYVYSVDVYNVIISGKNTALNDIIEGKIIKKQKHKMQIKNASMACINEFDFPAKDVNYSLDSHKRPVIAGFGPAGIFAALKLAEAGLKPIVIERGEPVDERRKTVENFWNTGELDTESNVQFGEGGAGTFSDGKLNTMIKDTSGRIRCMLETFVEFGADPSILYINKPHIGTDVLGNVVSSIRKHIIELGGEIRFNCKITDILTIEENSYRALSGLRLEHPQSFINYNAYGDSAYKMPAADYKVTYQTEAGRGVYSFCMCPGGYVVNASSEKNMLAVNGMSYSGRNSGNANSAIIVTVTPDDYGNNGALAGMYYQRELEKLAYRYGDGNVPVQLLGDFRQDRISTGFGSVTPNIKGSYSFANLRNVLGTTISDSISEGVKGFAKHIKGFDMEDAVFSGVESRTSSPVRIIRNENCESDIKGLFPCGEGAGYAGGITSAAVDGMKVAERIASEYIKKVTI